jgi:phosphoribosylformylglycinamidine synthase
MSGSFNDLDVPPTLVSFALAPGKASLALSPEFKKHGSTVSLVTIPRDADNLPDFEVLKQTADQLHQLNTEGKLLSLHHIGAPGLAAALAKCCFGNQLGFASSSGLWSLVSGLFSERYFTFLLEHTEDLPTALNAHPIGHRPTTAEPTLVLNGETHSLATLQSAWESTLEPVYPTKPEEIVDRGSQMVDAPLFSSSTIRYPQSTISRPTVLIPTFPGTNSEYDSAKAFREAGADAEILVFRNLSARHIEESLTALAEKIRQSQILMFPGGFSAGDEPDGSAKFIATIIRSPRVADAIMDLLKNRDGLILGICNGFQALIKTGLVPYGEISNLKSQISNPEAPTLVHNAIGRHISRYAHTRVTSTLSPWFSNSQCGDIHTIPLSHGEGRFFASDEIIAHTKKSGRLRAKKPLWC